MGCVPLQVALASGNWRFERQSVLVHFDRPIFLGFLLLLAGACSPRPKVDPTMPTPPPGTSWPSIRNDAGMLETSSGVTVYKDGKSDFALTLPAGFSGRLAFTADPTGPPVRGTVKLRIADAAAPPCVIDVAVEPSRSPEALAETIAAGREVFFVAETGEPAPLQPVTAVWTATHVIPDSARIDLGYWLFAPTYVLRIEGRFPVARLSTCKEALDAVVRSVSSTLRPEAVERSGSPG